MNYLMKIWGRIRGFGILIAFTFSLTSCSHHTYNQNVFTQADFEELLQRLAQGWNANDAGMAASVFAIDAIYSEPPNKQLYVGREAIFNFFGGENGRDTSMQMTWHHISYDPEKSVGAGEFTFRWPSGAVHGMVSIRVEGNLIKNWREYYYEDASTWEEFSRQNPF